MHTDPIAKPSTIVEGSATYGMHPLSLALLPTPAETPAPYCTLYLGEQGQTMAGQGIPGEAR
jgi:hypothetical protein